jgi:hypothetical protein
VTAEEAKTILGERLTAILRDTGFTPTTSNEAFVRPLAAGRQSIEVAFWDRRPSVDITLLVSVRLDAVEDVFHRFSGAYAEHRSLSSTVTTSLNYFVGGPSKVRFNRPEDLSATLDAWEGPMRTEVLPYLDSARDVPSLDRLVNTTRDILNIQHPPSDLMHHIILAALASNPAFDRLVAQHRAELRDIGCPPELYEKLVGYLTSLRHSTV